MRPALLTAGLSTLLIVIACERDPGRDVKPMADPMRSGGAPAAEPSEIIPLEKVSKSQAAAVSQRIANTEVTITCSRPVARGRELFGKLVPYNEVWNPGANQATAIALTRDVQVNGQSLARGKYSLWAIPRPETWTVISARLPTCITRRTRARHRTSDGRRKGRGVATALGRSHGAALDSGAVMTLPTGSGLRRVHGSVRTHRISLPHVTYTRGSRWRSPNRAQCGAKLWQDGGDDGER